MATSSHGATLPKSVSGSVHYDSFKETAKDCLTKYIPVSKDDFISRKEISNDERTIKFVSRCKPFMDGIDVIDVTDMPDDCCMIVATETMEAFFGRHGRSFPVAKDFDKEKFLQRYSEYDREYVVLYDPQVSIKEKKSLADETIQKGYRFIENELSKDNVVGFIEPARFEHIKSMTGTLYSSFINLPWSVAQVFQYCILNKDGKYIPDLHCYLMALRTRDEKVEIVCSDCSDMEILFVTRRISSKGKKTEEGKTCYSRVVDEGFHELLNRCVNVLSSTVEDRLIKGKATEEWFKVAFFYKDKDEYRTMKPSELMEND